MPSYSPSRRKPFPYDIDLGGTGFRLLPSDQGELISKNSQPIEAVPSTFEYGSADPRKEKTKAWSELYFGFGQAVEPSGRPRRVHFNLNVDDSINGLWMLGPRFTVETVATGSPIRGFVQALHGGVPTLFILADNGVYRRVADNNYSASLTASTTPALSAGSKPRQAQRFKDPAGNDRLYLATSADNLFSYDGAAWALAAGGAGPPENLALALTRIRDELWVGWGNKIAKAEADPMLRASYAGAITMGEGASTITWMTTIADQLLVIKTDGVFTVTSVGEAKDLFPALRFTVDPANGVNAAGWLEDVWIPWKNGFYKVDPTLILTPQGTEQLIENRSQVTGEWVGTAGHNTWFNYEVLYNRIAGDSHLLKYGSWADVGGGGDSPDPADFIPVHKGSLKKWAGKQATCVAVVPGITPTTLNDRLYVGFADGTIEYCKLPRSSMDPTQDDACDFTTDTGEIYLPQEHDGFQADQKVYLGFSIFGPRLDGNNYVQLDYRTSPDALWTPVQTEDASGSIVTASFTTAAQRADFPTGRRPVSKTIEVRARLLKTGAATSHQTPVVNAIGVHHQVRPAFAFDYHFTVQAHNRVAKHNGTAERRRAEQLRQAVIEAVATPGPVLTTFPDGSVKEITYIEYEDRLRNVRDRNGLEWDVGVRGIGLETMSQSTVGSTLTHGELEAYTHGQLESIL